MTGDRAVITGLGVVSSIGIGKDVFWSNLLAGVSAISPVSSFDTTGYDIKIAAEIKNFQPQEYLQRSEDQYARTSKLAIAAAKLAIDDSGLTISALQARDNIAVLMGTTMGETTAYVRLTNVLARDGMQAISREDYLQFPDSLIPINVCRDLGLDAACMLFHTACSAGNYAIGYGYDLIKSGQADLVIAGGADAFSQVAFIGFQRMLSLAHEKCQPFDKNRSGIVIGEGAGVVVMESLSSAKNRNARIYAEIKGYGMSCDAHNMTASDVEGVSAVMRHALQDSDIDPAKVDLICAHGTGTTINDRIESAAIVNVFGERGRTIPVISIKSSLGHTMGAASAIESIASVLTIYDGKIPPTINYETPDDECPLNIVANQMQQANVEVVLNNAFAFGNNNAATVFTRYSGL